MKCKILLPFRRFLPTACRLLLTAHVEVVIYAIGSCPVELKRGWENTAGPPDEFEGCNVVEK